MGRSDLREFLKQHFRRVTSSVAFIPQVDGLRALAVLLVMGHHVFSGYLVDAHRLGAKQLPQDWAMLYNRSRLVPWGVHLAFGVQIFFVISGFVLALPFARSAFERTAFPSTGLYLLRRLIRLEPPYVLNMTLLFALILFPLHKPFWFSLVMLHIFGPHYLASLVYLHAQIFGHASWINGIAWTLEIEVQFYLLMPLLARLFCLRRNALRRSLLAATVAAAGLFAQVILPQLHNSRLDLSLVGHLEFFLAGVLLADLYLEPPVRLRWNALAADLCALASAALLVYFVHSAPSLAWVEPFAVALFFWGTFHGRWASRLFAMPWLTVPGTMCYTIYLYHGIIVERCMPFAIRMFPTAHALWFDAAMQMVLMLPPVLLVSAILYLTIERPFIILSHRATRRWRASPVPAAAAPQVGV